MVTFISILKLITEIALMALLGRWVLGLLAGARRDSNLFYQILTVMTRPFIGLARLLTPRKVVLDRHIPLVAFLFVAFAWIVATLTKISLCVEMGVHLCR